MDDHSNWVAYAALSVSVASSLGILLEKVFGGGNRLATQFSELKIDTMLRVQTVRDEFLSKVAIYDENSKVGFTAITVQIHNLQLGMAEFRGMIAETYMRRESFYKAADEIKRDFKEANAILEKRVEDGFDRIQKTLDELAQAIEIARKENVQRHH